MTPFRYLKNLLVADDELLNAVLAGDARHTISARAGYAQWRGKAWGRIFAPVLDAVVVATHLGAPAHCRRQAVQEGLIPPPAAAG